MKKVQRILALLGVAALLLLVFLTLYFAITGSRYFMASLFCMIVLPVMLYGYLIVFRVFSRKNIQEMDTSDEE